MKFPLNKLHKHLDIPNQNEKLVLVGAVGFEGFGNYKHTRKSDVNSDCNGHYKSYIYEAKKNSWIVVDDLKNKFGNAKGLFKIAPRLIMYVKVKSRGENIK